MLNSNSMFSAAFQGAFSADGRFTHKISCYAMKMAGKRLDLNGLRNFVKNRFTQLLGKNCVIPQANCRLYFGMSPHPSALEQALYNFAVRSGFTLRVNSLLASGKEKAVDSMLITDAFLYTISCFAILTGDRDFVPVLEAFRSNGIPCILLTARFENTYCSKALQEQATEVIDVLSLIDDPNIFKPVNTFGRSGQNLCTGKKHVSARIDRQKFIRKVTSSNRIFFAGKTQNSCTYKKQAVVTRKAHSAKWNQNQVASVETAVKNVISRKSNLYGRPVPFAFQSDVQKELENMNVQLNTPLKNFLNRHKDKFFIGSLNDFETVSIKRYSWQAES